MNVAVTCGGGDWPEEVSWSIIDGDAELLSGGSPFEGCLGECGDDGGDGDVFLVIGESTVTPNGQVEVPLYYESSVPISGIQFTISDSPDWAVGVDMTSAFEDCFDVGSNDVDGNFMGILFSLEGCEIDASESLSHFATITYELSDEAEWGTIIELYYSDAIISDNEGNAISVITQGADLSVSMLGDINSDYEINILDAVTLINFILFIDQPNDYQFWAADINGDIALNIQDVVLLVNMVLPSLSREGIPTEATLQYGNNTLTLIADGAVSGLQIGVSGDFNITSQHFPDGWQMFTNENTILAFNMDGESITSGLLFEYEEDLSIESIMIVDSYGNTVTAKTMLISDKYSLLNSYPNPFNPATSINFTLSMESDISLEIYDIQGRMVEVLLNGNMQTGYHSVIWNANNHSNGIYFVKMVVGDFVNTQKLILLK